MINKIVRMLKQEQGFTLMELMIVVVILGILAGVAVPVYNGVQNTAREKVGKANAEMLNRSVRTWIALGTPIPEGVELDSPPSSVTAYSHNDHSVAFWAWMELDEVEYVKFPVGTSDTESFLYGFDATEGASMTPGP